MKFFSFILISVFLNNCEPLNTQIEVNEYIGVVSAYYRARNVWKASVKIDTFILIHKGENAQISLTLSRENIQSRFIGDSMEIPYLFDTPNHTIQGFVVNKRCDFDVNIFLREDQGIVFKNNHIWLFIDSETTSSNEYIAQYESEFSGFDATPISDIFIARRVEIDPIQWQLFDMYRINYHYNLEIMANGMIVAMNDDELRVVGANFSSVRRQNLKGAIVNCGIVIAYPEKFTYVDDPRNDHIDVFTKASIKLGENLLENLNISCHMYQTDSYGWPKNGSFDGVMGLFQRKQIQMTIHGVNMRIERLQHTEFAGDIFTPRTPLIFRQPPLSAVANIFVLPLELNVWICVCILLLVMFVIMLIQLMHPILEKLSISYLDVATFIWGAVCQQGTHLKIPTTSGRIVMLTSFFATLALFTSYSASIVALLQSPSTFIKSIDDLIASPLKVGMHEAGYARFIVKANYSGVSELYAKKVQPQGENGWIYDPFIGVERVRTELFAFQVDSPSAYKAVSRTYTESEKCSLSELQMIVLPRTTILVERNSGYKELMRQRMKWQKEVGLMKRDEIRWIPKKPDCEGGRRGFISVGLREIKPAAFLLLFGYGLSILFLITETLYRKSINRCSNPKKRKPKYQSRKGDESHVKDYEKSKIIYVLR